jgi:uncharacterized protein (DUF3820 family)
MADGETKITFGKFKGKTVEEIPSSYLKWLAEQDFMDKPSNYNLLEEVEQELEWRSAFDKHFEE